jgi:uncharacterized Zn finger protein
MAIIYIEKECPCCGKIQVFQEFSSWTGKYIRCMECGHYESELEDFKYPTIWDIINS